MKFPMDSMQIIPHRGKMKLIGDVLQYDDGEGTVEARIGSDSLFLTPDGQVETVVAVELIAQACAAINGLDGAESDEPARRGYLVSVDSADFYSPIPPDQTLSVHARRECVVGGFHIFSGQIRSGQELLAEARVKVWSPPLDDKG